MVKQTNKKLSDKQRRSRENLKPFKKGISGNPKGRAKKEFCIPDILRRIGKEIYDETEKKTYYDAMCEMAWVQAATGEKAARDWISNRMEGRAPDIVEFKVESEKFLQFDPDKLKGIPDDELRTVLRILDKIKPDEK